MKKTLKIAILLCLTAIVMLLMTSCDELLIKLQIGVETTMSDDGKPDDGKPDDSQPDNTNPDDGKIEDDTSNGDNSGEEPHVHTIEIIPAVEPTCTKWGSTEGKYCSECGEILLESEKIAPTEHSYGEWEIAVDPTDIDMGQQVRFCSCGEGETQSIETLKASQGLAFGTPANEEGIFIVGIGSCTDTDIVIPSVSPNGEWVKGIADYAFQDCTSITSITISHVNRIGNYAFQGCTSLANIVVHKFNENYQSINGDLYSKDGTVLLQYAVGKSNESFTVPESVTEIYRYAFYGCTSLTSIVIGDSVTSIGWNAFWGCAGLTNILVGNNNLVYYSGDGNCLIEKATNELIRGSNNSIIPEGVTSISDYAFNYCSSLANIVIPNSVTNIGSYAFYGCSSLTNIVIPDSVTSIGGHAFYGCNSLESITIPFVGLGNSNDYGYNDYLFGSIFGAQTYDENKKCVPASLKTVVITGDDYIAQKAFYNCSYIESISIPDSITYIGKWAFEGCYGLLEEENGIIYVDKWVINGNGGGATPILRENTVGIATNAFSYCGITSIIIPNSVTIIGENAFYNCERLTNITIPDSVTSIGYYAFWNCSSLTSITIPDGIKSIGNYAFYGCSNLKSIVFEGTVEQWNTIDFGYSWNLNILATEVICTDGVVKLK